MIQEKNGGVKIWVEEEIKINCRYEKGQDFIKATLVFPTAISSIGYVDLLKSHPEISKVDALPENRLVMYVKVEKSMPFWLMVRKCLGVVAGTLYVRVSE